MAFFRALSLVVLTFSGCVPLHAQAAKPVSPPATSFPYRFANFPWWSDINLCAELKRRIPALGDQIELGSRMEARVRIALTEMLKEKGVVAEVQITEPSLNVSLLNRVQDAPAPAIVFSVLAPPRSLSIRWGSLILLRRPSAP